jgi:hypothetical protein
VTTLILKRAPIGSNQEDYALMPHFAPIFFIAFASLAASCASERAQKEATEREEIGRQLTAAYYSCVRTSFASMRPTMVDRNMGIDQAFMVCRAEESKLQAFEKSLSENPNVSSAAIAGHRNTLKETLAAIVLVRRVARTPTRGYAATREAAVAAAYAIENVLKGLIAFKRPGLIQEHELHGELKTHDLNRLSRLCRCLSPRRTYARHRLKFPSLTRQRQHCVSRLCGR